MKLHTLLENQGKASTAEELIKSIKGGRFTLDGRHLIITNYFDCSHYELISLEGAPKEVDDDFICTDNKLTTLEGALNM